MIPAVAFFSLVATLFIFSCFFYGASRLLQLEKTTISLPQNPPLVSILVAARNEERNIEAGLKTLLETDYPSYEIIVVDDRSTDATAAIALGLQKDNPELGLVRVNELPAGWMGKQHALDLAARHAVGEILLFTDADVRLESSVISRAVSLMEKGKLDHITLLFRNLTKGWLLNSFIVDAGVALLVLFRPWLAANPGSPAFIGVGAFNMVRASSYHGAGGHSRLRMHPLDDLMLGKIMKESGYKQLCLEAATLVKVPWYDSMAELVAGLQKNLFSVLHYRLFLIPFVLMGVCLVGIAPVVGLFLGEGASWIFFMAAFCLRLATLGAVIVHLKLPFTLFAGVLVTPFFSIYLVINVVVKTLLRDGIVWRGTHYSLAELKRSEPLFF